jgi:hypothetical protein
MSASIPSEFDTEELVKLLHKKFGFACDRVKRGRVKMVYPATQHHVTLAHPKMKFGFPG